MSDSDAGGRYSSGPGKSFLMQIVDVPYASCGSAKDIYTAGEDEWDINREVKVLSNGAAQVTCHGTTDEFPVKHFPSHAGESALAEQK